MTGTNETRVVNATGGAKGSKDERFDLLPWEQLAEVSKLYKFGAEKYEAHNYMLGYDWHLSFASLMRHAAAWWMGEFDDEESKCDHMASVVFHALALMYFRHHHPDLDDRPHTALARRRGASTPAEAPEAVSGPQDGAGGAIRAVFRHVSGMPALDRDGNPLALVFVRTGDEAPPGYRFSHVEPDVDGLASETIQRAADAHEATLGQQVVPRPGHETSMRPARTLDELAERVPRATHRIERGVHDDISRTPIGD